MESRPGTALGGQNGLELYKLRVSRTSGAWDQIFKITQWNYIAFSAAALLSSTGIVVEYLEKSKGPVIYIICFFIIIVSLMASILAYVFHNYAYQLHEKEYQTLKAWLKDKDGRVFVEEMRAEGISSYAKRSEGIEFTRAGICDLVTNIYFCINLAPALTATVLLLFVWLRPLPL